MNIKGKDYKINRETAKVTEYDKQYCNTLKEIINKGELSPNRTGIETLSIPQAYFKLDVKEEFPILETKKVFIKNTITELLWIYQAQSNVVEWLNERDNHIWDSWKIDDDGIYRIYDPYKNYNDGNTVSVNNVYGMTASSLYDDKTIIDAKYFGKEYAGTIGTAYGYVIKNTNKFNEVLRSLKENPRNRRMNISLSQDNYLGTSVLEPCVWANTYKYYKGKLYSNVEIRSNDMPLGNPFNVTQYAVLLSLLAKVSNMDVGSITFDISDCHVYIDQLNGIKLQLLRFDLLCKWENYIKTHTDEEVNDSYNELIERQIYLDKKVKSTSISKDKYKEIINMTNEEIMALEHLITRENPYLYIADEKGFFEFDNKKNNDDIKVLKYTSMPAIKMDVSQ